jgi:serine/threonine-protein kinase
MSFFAELKRRSVFRVAIGYVGVSWLILQVVDVLFGIFDYDTDIDETIVIVLAIGFFPAMILAWVFELTPEGIKRDAETDHDAPAMRDFGRRIDRIVIAILSVAVIFFAIDKFWPSDPAPGPSIAVLPFTSVGADSSQQLLAVGMTTQLRSMLTGVKKLRVMAGNTVDFYLDGGGGPRAMYDEHGVAHVLEGAIQTAGDQLRITATLVDLASGTQVWSDTFDRELKDVFAIQDEIASAVIARLNFEGATAVLALSRKVDIEAYKRYLQASHLMEIDKPGISAAERLEMAITLLEQAVEIEPEYVDAWLELTLARFWLARRVGEERAEELRALSEQSFDRAQTIDPNHPVVLAYDGGGRFLQGGDTQTIASLLERAVEAAPTDPDVVRAARQFMTSIGRDAEAVAIAELAVDRDPKCPQCWYVLSQALRDAGRSEKAAHAGEIALSLGMPLEFSIAKTQLYQHNPDGMLDLYDHDRPAFAQGLYAYAMALYTAGRKEEFDSVFAELLNDWGDTQPLYVAMVYAWLENADAAFDWLGRSIELNKADLQMEYRSPFFFNLRGDPRWGGVLRRIERHPEQLAKIEFDPDIPEVR